MSGTKPLNIYKASAGSGKTFTLVREYLRLLLKTGDTYRFKRIVAMTFTNKAALEMKERVIKTLHQLSIQDEKDKGLVQNYAVEFQMSPEELGDKARKALSSILHNYSDLNIRTIDKFNVRLIRSFIRDLNMSNDFEILVDTSEFNEKVVDKFLDAIHSRNREEIKNQLITAYLEEKLERGDSWEIRQELIDTLQLFEKETYRNVLPQLLSYDFNFENLKRIKNHIKLVEEDFEKRKKATLTSFLLNYNSEDFKKLFQNKNAHYVRGNFDKTNAQDLSKFKGYTPGSFVAMQNFFQDGGSGPFYEQLYAIHEFYDKTKNQLKEEYLSYKAALSSFFQLAVLKYLIEQVEIQKLADNVIPLVEVNNMISNQMRLESADYIYERVGVRFDHFLLDEFQDTSRMQWLNMIPLLHNAMAQNQANLIVGDSKQAIYRFRNGIVEQFADLPKIYNPEGEVEYEQLSAYFEVNASPKTLNDNWRSRKDIVKFNNHLFQNLRQALGEEYQQYYADDDLIQNVVNEKTGFVYVELEQKTEPKSESNDNSSGSSGGNEDEDNESELEFGPEEEFLIERITNVLSRGFQPKDICVLANKNKELGKWAKLLISKGFEVSTDEGLVVSNSARVKFLVAWMHLISKPGSAQFQRNFVISYMLLTPDKKQDDFLQYFKRNHFEFSAFLEDHFETKQIHQLRYENLYDLVLKMLRQLDIDELSDPFLHFFCNMTQNFDINFGPHIERFLHFYNTRGKDKKIPLAQGNAIRLMTAHKSKGLEFHVVIMPKTAWDWQIKSGSHLFFDEEKSLFYMAEKKAKNNVTKLQELWAKSEEEKNKLDVFNLFYVSCTRAVDELHLRVSRKGTKSDADTKISGLSHYLIDYFENQIKLNSNTQENQLIHTVGEPVQFESKQTRSENLLIHLHGETLWFPEISLIDRESLEDMDIHEDRIFGRLVHLVLENMQGAKDLKIAFTSTPKLTTLNPKIKEKIEHHIQALCQNPNISSLIFPNIAQGEHTLDEREIVLSAHERIRPDRVIVAGNQIRIIEYKTGLERPRDIKQLEQYVFALREMGYQNCEAYLIYTDAMLVKQVC